MYLATFTTPGIANMVSQLNQFLNWYDKIRWNIYKSMKTINFEIIFWKTSNEPLFRFTDVDWIKYPNDRKSQ